MIDWLAKLDKDTVEQPAQVCDMDGCATGKEAITRYWRFRQNGVEVDIPSGATVTEACELLRCGSTDTLEPIIRDDGQPDIGALILKQQGVRE